MSFIEEVREELKNRGIKPLSPSRVRIGVMYATIGLDMACFPCVCSIFVTKIDKEKKTCTLNDDGILICGIGMRGVFYSSKHLSVIDSVCKLVVDRWGSQFKK